MPNMDTVGQRIQYVRTNLGLTLEQLAERAGVSKSFLWEVEHDNSGMSGERLLRMANALGASLDFLLRGEPAAEGYQPKAIEIPWELGELAETLGLTYSKTLAMLKVESSFVARRSSGKRERKSADDWRALYESVKQYLEDT